MFVIVGATGHTGGVVAAELLSRGEPVRVVVRAAARGEPFAARSAQVAVASADDAGALSRALEGARGLYFVVPQDFTRPGLHEASRRYVGALREALATRPVPHVVYLSSWGAEIEGGPLRMHGEAERALAPLAERGVRCTFLRATYFMENTMATLPLTRETGVMPSLVDPERKSPMVATRDIGAAAVAALLAPPTRTEVVEVTGPAEGSMAELAAAWGKRLGRSVVARRVPLEGLDQVLGRVGYAPDAIAFHREMVAAFEGGRLRLGAPDVARRWVGETSVESFVEGVRV
jgi:uncharacterized protein YbjT (DUF2867 family)